MMTVGEHDKLWMAGAKSIINCEAYLNEIRVSMKRRNAIEIMKELHRIGAISDEDYKNDIVMIVNNEGFGWADD